MKFLTPALLIIIFYLSSCHKTEIQGMEVYALNEDIDKISLEVSNDKPDFGAGDSVYFVGNFEKLTTVSIEITGRVSGAVKKIQLNADELNQNNSIWFGGSSTLIGFQKELCDVQISFVGTEIIIKREIEIVGITNFDHKNTIGLESNGFETNSSSEFFKNCTKVDDFIAAQGNVSVKVPYEVNNPYLFLGEDNLGSGNFYNLPIDPKRVWFNIYVFGTGDANARMFIEFKEADQDNLAYQNGRDDGVQAFIPLSHQGWQLFSFRYSDLGFSSVSAFGGSGNKTHEPAKIQMTTYNFENNGGEGVFYFDLPIYTIDHPFDSNNY